MYNSIVASTHTHPQTTAPFSFSGLLHGPCKPTCWNSSALHSSLSGCSALYMETTYAREGICKLVQDVMMVRSGSVCACMYCMSGINFDRLPIRHRPWQERPIAMIRNQCMFSIMFSLELRRSKTHLLTWSRPRKARISVKLVNTSSVPST